MTFSVTSIIGQACLLLLKFEKKILSNSLETSSVHFIEKTQCRTLNNISLLGSAIVYQYITSKISAQILIFDLILTAINLKALIFKCLIILNKT